jgi:hypothetical protein
MADSLETVRQVTILQGLNAPTDTARPDLPYAKFSTEDIMPLVINAKQQNKTVCPHEILEILDAARKVLNCDGFKGLEFTKAAVCHEVQESIANKRPLDPPEIIRRMVQRRDLQQLIAKPKRAQIGSK